MPPCSPGTFAALATGMALIHLHAALRSAPCNTLSACQKGIPLLQEGHSGCATISKDAAAPDDVTPVRLLCNMLNMHWPCDGLIKRA